MENVFYAFILNLWVMGSLTEDQVRSYAPFYFTEDDANMIILTPQKTTTTTAATE